MASCGEGSPLQTHQARGAATSGSLPWNLLESLKPQGPTPTQDSISYFRNGVGKARRPPASCLGEPESNTPWSSHPMGPNVVERGNQEDSVGSCPDPHAARAVRGEDLGPQGGGSRAPHPMQASTPPLPSLSPGPWVGWACTLGSGFCPLSTHGPLHPLVFQIWRKVGIGDGVMTRQSHGLRPCPERGSSQRYGGQTASAARAWGSAVGALGPQCGPPGTRPTILGPKAPCISRSSLISVRTGCS